VVLKYLKTYEGVTSGTHMGRDDGYPETKVVTYTNIEDLEKGYAKQKKEQYYILVPMDDAKLAEELKDARLKKEQHAKIKRREDILEEIERLEHELGKLY
jgi:hypothetical protein